ncbi:MAG: PQQ-binding-like beta-propeller repeat protein [Thermomicrobiales bacterium]
MISRRDAVKLGTTGLVAPALGMSFAPHVSARQAEAPALAAADVPMFRGNPARTGVQPGPAPDDSAGIGIRWQADTNGWIGGAPAVANDTVFIGTGGGSLSALSLQNGALQWQFPVGGRVTSAPAVVDGIVYFGSEDETFYALDASTGQERWRFASGQFPGHPAVAEGIVLASGGPQVEMTVSALDAQDGSERWRFAHDAWTTLVPAIADGATFFSTGSTVHALDLQTGDEIWRQIATGDDDRFGLELAVANGTVFVPRGLGVSAFSAADGTEQWRTTSDQFVTGNLAVDGETVYAGSFEFHTIVAANAGDGRQIWLYSPPDMVPDASAPSRYGFNDVAVAGGVVVATRGFSAIHAVDAATGAARWQLDLPVTGKNTLTAPVIVGGLVLIGSSFESTGTLYALGSV